MMQRLPGSPPALPTPPGTSGSTPGPVLRDIHVPADPSWWPPAPGWWVLAGVLAVLIVLALWQLRRLRSRRQWRDRVLIELDEVELAFRQDGDRLRLTGALHALLRRAAAGLDPAARSASGRDWEIVIDRIRVDPVVRAQLLGLDHSMYQRHAGAEFDPDQAIAAVRRWMTLALHKLAVERAGRPRRSA